MRCIFVHYRTVYLTDSCSSIVIPFCPRPHVSVRARDWSIVSNQYMAEERSFGGSFGTDFIFIFTMYVVTHVGSKVFQPGDAMASLKQK